MAIANTVLLHETVAHSCACTRPAGSHRACWQPQRQLQPARGPRNTHAWCAHTQEQNTNTHTVLAASPVPGVPAPTTQWSHGPTWCSPALGLCSHAYMHAQTLTCLFACTHPLAHKWTPSHLVCWPQRQLQGLLIRLQAGRGPQGILPAATCEHHLDGESGVGRTCCVWACCVHVCVAGVEKDALGGWVDWSACKI